MDAERVMRDCRSVTAEINNEGRVELVIVDSYGSDVRFILVENTLVQVSIPPQRVSIGGFEAFGSMGGK